MVGSMVEKVGVGMGRDCETMMMFSNGPTGIIIYDHCTSKTFPKIGSEINFVLIKASLNFGNIINSDASKDEERNPDYSEEVIVVFHS